MTKNDFDNLSIGQNVGIKSGPLKSKYYGVNLKVVDKHILQIPQRLYVLSEYREIVDGLPESSLLPFAYVVEMVPDAWEPRRSSRKSSRESYIVTENSVCALYQDIQILPVLTLKEE